MAIHQLVPTLFVDQYLSIQMSELTSKQQLIEMLKNKQKFLILTHKDPDGDALGSSLAMYLTLKRLGKDAAVVCTGSISDAFKFLPQINIIKDDFKSFRDFVISLNVSDVKAEKVMYKVENNQLDIIITPQNGDFTKEMISFPKGGFNFDAIIIFDCTDFERLGSIYEENSDAFFEIPTINVDHHAGNSYFAKINFVDLTATSSCEILASVIESLTGDPKFFDPEIATALLTGIITDTNSFQNTNTTPKSLTVAAQLVALGAKQQEIIKEIYKTKRLSTLKLWGKALSNLKFEENYPFVWTFIKSSDYASANATETESEGLIDELLKTTSGSDFALMLSEKGGDLHGSLRSTSVDFSVKTIAELFGGGGHPMASGFQINNSDIVKSSEMIINKIKNWYDDNQTKEHTVIEKPLKVESKPEYKKIDRKW